MWKGKVLLVQESAGATRERNIKDTSDGLRVDVWIMVMHCTYGDGYGLCRFVYFELYIGRDIMLRAP